jgi:hypothetical protein
VDAAALTADGVSRPVFHIVPAGEWRAVRGAYEPASLRAEGFVHCSDAAQVLRTAARFFAGRADLVLLEIDPGRVAAQLRYENLEGGEELYPHLYGAIDAAAVLSAQALVAADDGGFVAPQSLRRALHAATELKRVCVFAGSSPGALPEYRAGAEAFGRALATRGLTLVYGGSRVGLMGHLAEAALAQGGTVVGVIPRALLAKEVAHPGLSELCIVASMHERKATMAERSDAFVALPGGIGTLEELFEVLTWAQLGFHGKPCAILDVGGYYRQLLAFLDHAVQERFVRAEHRAMLIVETSAERLLDKLRAHRAPAVEKWIDREST